jgi:hypothetical protein
MAAMLRAVEHIRRVRGGSQAQVMRADDGHDYITKMQGNPQDTRILANELLACRLARLIGLPVPEPVVIEVDDATIRQQLITFTLAGRNVMPHAGPQFGSRLVTDDQVFDFFPDSLLSRVRGLRMFAGILAFDKWTANADGRQVVFHKRNRARTWHIQFIDFGYCFNASEWSFPDAPLRGTYARNNVYDDISGWNDFEPWLSRIEHFPEKTLFAAAEDIPTEWYAYREDLDRLLTTLLERRSRVRDLVDSFRLSARCPFRNWGLACPISAAARPSAASLTL